MKLFQFINLVSLGIIFDLTACSALTPSSPTPISISFPTQSTQAVGEISKFAVTPTIALSPTRHKAESLSSTVIPSPTPTTTNTSAPVATLTFTSSPTLEITPMVKVNKTLAPISARAGPALNYPIVSQFQPDQEIPVTGRNEDMSWWQVSLGDDPDALGWVFGQAVTFSGDDKTIPIVAVPPPPSPTPQVTPTTSKPKCNKDFCVTHQAMVPFAENGGCTGNHSIYITVLEGPPPGRPMDGVVLGDTFNNVEAVSGEKGPGAAEITLWMNSMSIKVKRHISGTPYTSEKSLPFTALDELIPPEILAANGYCESNVEKCKFAHDHNQVCRGHYSYRVTFHKFD